MDLPSTEELKKLRVVDLKERLSKHGKSTSGLKADLVARLYDALAEQAGNVDMVSPHQVPVGFPQVEELPELQPMNPEPPVVEVTIDTSQFECGVEPQIVHEVDLYYQHQHQQEEEARIQAMLHRQQQEEELQRQQEEVERQQLQHEQILLQRQQEEAELLRQRQMEEAERQRLEQEERIRWQQEEEFRRIQEAENLRREQEEHLMAQEKAKEEERLRCQQLEEEKRRREELEEAERQRQELERIRWQEEEYRRMQEAEMLRQKQEMEERMRKEQEEAERARQEYEAAERARREYEEAERMKRAQEEIERAARQEAERAAREEAERIRMEREVERIKQEQEEAKRIRREQEEAERIRKELENAERARVERQEAERARIRQQEEAERARIKEEEVRLRREREEAERVRLEQEKAEIRRREQEEAERQRIEFEKAERARREHEEAELRRRRQEEAERIRQEQEKLIQAAMAERTRLEREEVEKLRFEEAERQRLEELKIKEVEEKLRIQRLEKEEKERQHQEYLDKQTAAALIQIPVQVPVHSGPSLPPPDHIVFQPKVPGMTQPWTSASQPGFPPQLIMPPSGHMVDAPPGYGNAAPLHQYPGEMSSPPHSSSPPPIPGLGPPSPSQTDVGKPPALMSLEIQKPDEDGQDDDMRLPQALEKVLAYKMERAQMLGVDPDTITTVAVDEEGPKELEEDRGNEMEVSTAVAKKVQAAKDAEPKPSKNKQRKLKKKKRARHRRDVEQIREISMDEETGETEPDVEVQYIEDSLDLNPTDPMYHHFMKIFEAFKLTDPEAARREAEEEANRLKLESKKEPDLRKKPKDADEDLEEEQSKKEEQPKLSKRKLKKLNRLSIAELKQHVNRPDVVEMHDVTAKDPRLLVILKSTRNTVPVPRHWCFKRKFLQGKRGIEKPPFDLPDFIKKTGIMEMRQALQEKEDQKTLKAKMRERVRPKMGKIDIDYQKLHDAFFKWQTKPKMTIHGDLYYEGKEFETRLKEKKPGELSDDLRTALGMPVGPNSQKVPPPWLIAMQRYGPPPSYPNLKIPGLNSPIPDGCSFGYHAGGWGKPPVDEMGKPLYGDVFGMQGGDHQQPLPEEEVDRTLWGELESESESESEEEDEEEEEEEEDEMELEEMDKSGFVTPAEGGLVTPSGMSSISMGMETPDMIELRKKKIESEMEGGETPALYTILPEKKTDRIGGAMMGSTHIYDIAAAMPGRPRLGGSNTIEGGVDVALDPSELDLDAATMTARYEQTLREQQNQLEKEDLSDMVAEHSAKQKNKRKRAAGEQHTGRAVKKYKDFKF